MSNCAAPTDSASRAGGVASTVDKGAERTAFVLSGGGSLGAVQVGMLQALSVAGVEPDLLVGTSAGAVNAAWVAGHGMGRKSLEELATLWRGLRRSELFPIRPAGVVGATLGRSPALCTNNGLAHLIATHAGFGELDGAGIETHLVATDLLTGHPVLLSAGPVTTAVCASAAVPGLYPPVLMGERHLIDGGVSHHSGIGDAVAMGATTIWVLPTGHPCARARPPRTAIGVALQALTMLIEQRLVDETHGMLKFVVDADTGSILGATLFCVDSQELVNLVALAMRSGVSAAELRDGIWTHPSSTEALNEVLAALP